MTDVAMAAGFASIRRFNDTIYKTYGRSPSELRRQKTQLADAVQVPTIALKLPFSPPLNWAALIQFLMLRATPGLESATMERYQRVISLNGCHGLVEVRPIAEQNYLIANIYIPKVSLLAQIVERLRQMFDLNANVADISAHLQQDSVLAPIVAAQPGLRIPGTWDPFELSVRAILGQQISVIAATTLAGRLVSTYGEPFTIADLPWADASLRFVFPKPETLVKADLTKLGIPRSKTAAILSLAAAVVERSSLFTYVQTLDDVVQTLCQLPGIGEWTAHYIAMCALREPDAFPANDLGLLRAMKHLGEPVTKARLLQRSHVWRPWRAYAAMHLWSFDSARLTDKERLSA